MPSERKRQVQLAEQARMWAQLERRFAPRVARLIHDHMNSGAQGYLDNRLLGADLALSKAEQGMFQILAAHYVQTGRAFGNRTFGLVARKSRGALGRKAQRDDTLGGGGGGPTGYETAFEEHLAGWVRAEGLTQAKRLVGTTRADLRALIAFGESEGFSSAKIAREIRKSAPGLARIRSIAIAQTETHNAATFAGQEAARSLGVEMRKTWLSHRDGRARLTHVEASNQTRKLDEPYEVGGFKLMRPGDASLGAPASEIVRCRCGETHEPVE